MAGADWERRRSGGAAFGPLGASGRRWANGLLRPVLLECRGQSTVEYALLLFAFLALVLGLGAVWGAAQDGALVRLAEGAASHVLGSFGGWRDIALF